MSRSTLRQVDSSLRARLEQDQQSRRDANRWRQRTTLTSAQQPQITVEGQALINFSSNDYLGLANRAHLKEASARASAVWGVGSGASHLVCGHQSPHHELEQALATFVGAERAVLFSSGYLANLAIGTAFAARPDLILQDKFNHASLIDGALLGKAQLKRYAHLSTIHAQSILEKTDFRHSLIVSDGVFSMDGDLADLAALKQLADKWNGTLVVDDAHGLGVLGPSGRGTLALCGLRPADNVIMMGTLGKAFGGFGAFVAGDEIYIEHLIQTARSYIYTTAIPPAVAITNLTALRLLLKEGRNLRATLNARISQFRDGAKKLGLTLMPSTTAVQPLVLGSETAALSLSQSLQRLGFMVKAIRPPTVPEGTSRLRFTLSAAHTEQQVDDLLRALKSALAIITDG